MPIENDFPFLTEKGHIVSLVGGGGKTTLMYAMAAHCVRKNWHVLVTTTTHIMRPPGAVWARTDADLFRLWKHGSYAVAGTAAPGGKMTVPPQKQLEHWMQLADIVLIEADGSDGCPARPRLHMSRCSCRGAISCLRLQAFLHWGNHWKKDASGQNWHSRFCVSREMLC